jgi:hypothetical protein
MWQSQSLAARISSPKSTSALAGDMHDAGCSLRYQLTTAARYGG